MEIDAIPPSSPPAHANTSHVDISPFFEPRSRANPPKSSSPPPLFSSDDSRESVDVTNYQSPRIFKNKRKGAWWDNGESAQHTPEPKKTRMARNFDSGVYMMSDATDSSEDPLPLHRSPFPFSLASTCDERDDPLLPRPNLRAVSFNDKIRSGLDENHEVYDFQGLDLEDEDIKDVGRIASVIKNVPDPGDVHPELGHFRSMEPEIYINFTDNNLCRLTLKLFDVQYLTTLVLRNNNIKELPQQLIRLKNLKILNVSLNLLESLPFEILGLLKPYGALERVHTVGNPMLEPMTSVRFHHNAYIGPPHGSMWYTDALPLDHEREEASVELSVLYDGLAASTDRVRDIWRIRYLESWENSFGYGADARQDAVEEDVGFFEHHPPLSLDRVSPKTPRYIARTAVSYFDRAGYLIKDSPTPPRADQLYPIILEPKGGAFGVPSSWFERPSQPLLPTLSTMSLHNVLKARHINNLTIKDICDMLVDHNEAMPQSVEAMFTRAIENNTGEWGEFRKCHVCKKDYVVSQAEWVEFWSVDTGVFHPLKVKVCSWGCVPAEVAKRPEKELTW